MLYLDSEDSSKPIYLYINCPGGSVIAGLALFDTMQHVKSPIVTINLGLAVHPHGTFPRPFFPFGAAHSSCVFWIDCELSAWLLLFVIVYF
jgi:hypothetical protein